LRRQRFDGAAMLGVAPVGPFVRLIEFLCSFAAAPRSRSISSSARFSVARNRSPECAPVSRSLSRSCEKPSRTFCSSRSRATASSFRSVLGLERLPRRVSLGPRLLQFTELDLRSGTLFQG
jgi:hypothetical protein